MTTEKGIDINKSNLLLSIMYIGIMLVFSIFRDTFNSDCITFILFILFCIYLLKNKFYIFPKYLFVFFYSLYFLTGVFICENSDIFLSELQINASYHGSFSIAVIYNILLIYSLIFFDNIFSKKMKYKKFKSENNKYFSLILKMIYPCLFIVGLILFLSVVNHPSFEQNMDRFIYENEYSNSLLKKIESYYLYCIPLVLLPIFAKNKEVQGKDFVKILITLIPYLLYEIWIGNKFGPFFNIVIFILAPVVVYIGKKNKNKQKKCFYENRSSEIYDDLIIKNDKISKGIFIKLLIVISVLILTILFSYYKIRGNNIADFLFKRTAQQGQLWWKTYELEKEKTMHLNELDDEIYPFFKSNLQPEDMNYGVYKIMKLTTPSVIYNMKVLSGSRYSAQGIEIAFYYFKYIGIVAHAIIRGFFEAFLVNLLIKLLFSNRVICSIIITRFIVINHAIFTQGDLCLFFSNDSIILIIVFILFEILYYKNERKFNIRE